MINLEEIKQQKYQPPFLGRPAQAQHFYSIFNFSDTLLAKEFIKIRSPLLKKGGWGSNFDLAYVCSLKILIQNLLFYFSFLFNTFSQASDVSNFIGSDQKVAPYQLVGFQVMTPKSYFLLIGAGTITPKGSMNTVNFEKTLLFVEQNYEQQTSTRLWSVRVDK